MTLEQIHPRRKDRSKDEVWIRAFLHRAGAGVFVTVRDGVPYPVPMNFVYDASREVVYLHTGKAGRSRNNLDGAGEDGPAPTSGSRDAPEEPKASPPAASGAPAALCAYEMGRFLPADEALEFGVEYASVVVFGAGSVVEDPEEAEGALTLLMEKYAPHMQAGRDYRPVAPQEVRRTTVIRLDIQGWSGKEKAEGPDFPGAYRLEDVRPSP